MAASDARPVPQKNTAYRQYFAIRKNDGTLITSWTAADTELSKDGGAFADATNEATEIGTSGVGYIDLTAGEMNYDSVVIKTTVTNTGALPIVIILFPEEVGDIRANASQFGGQTVSAAGTVTMPGTVASTTNITAGTITTVSGNVNGSVASVTGNVGGSVASVTTVNGLAANVITAASIAAGAIEADAYAANAITASAIADGTIIAAKFGSGAIDATALNANAANEIRDAVWAKTLTELAAIPGVTAAIIDAINFIFTLSRNKITQNATEQALFLDDGSTKLAETDVSEVGGTFTRGEWRAPT